MKSFSSLTFSISRCSTAMESSERWRKMETINRETKNMENWTSKREKLIVSMHSSIMTAHSPAFGNSCNPRCKSQHCAVTVSLVLVDDTDFKSYLSLSRYDVCVAKFILPKLLNWLKFHHQPTNKIAALKRELTCFDMRSSKIYILTIFEAFL